MDYKDTVLPILRESREMLLSQWGTAEVVAQKDESAVNVVTELDKKVETFVSGKLKAVYPEIEFVGEEFGGNRSAGKLWLMDPIDGTGHYIRGLPFCTSMIALVENGKVIFSAIYDFINDDMYWAQKGQGAYKNEVGLKVSSRSLKQSYIGWETHLDKEENLKIFHELRKRSILIKTVASGWEYAMIASGKLDARVAFDPHGKDYDFAPGALLVMEAGGKVVNLYSDQYDYRNTNFIAANEIIFKELTEGPEALFPIKGFINK
ncbi:MAG TPA: inositol monophosphatase family protein [Verrucomicrobiae bacterium]|nr:inositol monophosphatase family protein [Verrucomicrobiae bacterium]